MTGRFAAGGAFGAPVSPAGGFGAGSLAGGCMLQAVPTSTSSSTSKRKSDWLVRADRLKCRLARRTLAPSVPSTSDNRPRSSTMWVIALEAFVALCLLVLIVWLTMGSSRRREEDSPPQPGHHQNGQDKNGHDKNSEDKR
ncbi:MAG: hypothetical protein ACREUX_00625 [Burkholderiales bacterium]